MLDKIKRLILTGSKLAEFLENNGELKEAYLEYLKIGDHRKAGKILEKQEKWHEAANLYLLKNDVDLARRAIESCFKRNEAWETYEPDNNSKITIEDWLKQNDQVRRFARYVRHTDTLDKKGNPLVVNLANKLKQIREYKSAAELYEKGFDLINKEKDANSVVNEVWLRYAAESYAKAKMYQEAAKAMKRLITTEVDIGDALPLTAANPYRNYTHNLTLAKEWNFLPQLLEILEDFDPFNIAYDLLKMDEPELSMKVFFKFFGSVLKKNLTDGERDIRNKRIQYCFNQYIIYYREKKEYIKAAEIALLNSQKEIAAELYLKADQEKEKSAKEIQMPVEEVEAIKKPQEEEQEDKVASEMEILKCPVCGEIVEADWELCPSCDNVLNLDVCECGQKIKVHWKRCPACKRPLNQPKKSKIYTYEDTSKDSDTKPMKMIK